MSTLPHTITFLTTDRCTANCRTCGVGASPNGSLRLSIEAMGKHIDEAVELGVQLVVFSGGEPLLLEADLDAAVIHASLAGMLTRVVSNGYWAISEAVAFKRLEQLKKAGLCEINFSTGDIHRKFVPVQNVIYGILASLQLGMSCALMIELHKNSGVTRQRFLDDEQLSKLLKNPKVRKNLFFCESPWVDVSREASQDQDKQHLLTGENIYHRPGCTSVLGGIAIDPDERLGACCGITRNYIPELTVGSLKQNTMAELIEIMKRDFMKRWLFTQGPEHIMSWVAEHDPGIVWEGKYAHQCHACYAVYNNPAVRVVLAEHWDKRLLDVSFQYWMMNKYI